MQKEKSAKYLRQSAKYLKQEEQTFLRRFLPDNVRSAHTVLFDPDENVDFIPTTDQLQSCLEAYLRLIEKVAQYGCEAVRGCISASELTLGYLSRAVRAGIRIPSFSRKQYMFQMIEGILFEASKVHQNWKRLDGYKRIIDIAYLLKQDL